MFLGFVFFFENLGGDGAALFGFSEDQERIEDEDADQGEAFPEDEPLPSPAKGKKQECHGEEGEVLTFDLSVTGVDGEE